MSDGSSSQHTSEKSTIYSTGLQDKTKLQQDKIDEYNRMQAYKLWQEQQNPRQQQNQQNQQNLNYSGSNAILYLFFMIFISMWIIVSIYAIVKSFLCIPKSGSIAEKIVGVIMAFFLGPFYLIYLYSNDNYCKDLPVI
jgi:hypothetical protein